MGVDEYVSGLERVEESGYPTYCSVGARERALRLSTMAEKGYAFLREFFQVDFEMPLLVLNQEDWKNRTQIYDYGVIYAGSGCIHFPADEDHTFLDLVQPLYDSSPEHLKQALIKLVGEETPFKKGFGIFLDSKIVHEFTHVCLRNMNINFGLRWFNEFFCDYTNYAFLKRHESDYQFILEIQEFMPHIMYEGGLPHAKYTKSVDFENLYFDMGWLNCMWFYSRNMRGVIELYRVYGEDFIHHVIDAFKPSNESLVRRLEATHKGLGHMFKTWLEKNP